MGGEWSRTCPKRRNASCGARSGSCARRQLTGMTCVLQKKGTVLEQGRPPFLAVLLSLRSYRRGGVRDEPPLHTAEPPRSLDVRRPVPRPEPARGRLLQQRANEGFRGAGDFVCLGRRFGPVRSGVPTGSEKAVKGRGKAVEGRGKAVPWRKGTGRSRTGSEQAVDGQGKAVPYRIFSKVDRSSCPRNGVTECSSS